MLVATTSAVVQALYHRDRTGEGQKVDTAIVNAHLLNASMAWMTPDHRVVADRQKLDRMAMGWNALYRLYQCADGWLCVAALTDDHWAALCGAIGSPQLADDPRFATAEARREHDAELIAVLDQAFAGEAVDAAWKRLDAAGVPAEISSADYILRYFEDPANHERQRLTTFQDPIGGTTTALGLLVDFSDTPGKFWGPPLVVGRETREIMGDLGYDDDAIDKLCAQGSVTQATP